jgi:hypothetical protein
MTQRDRREYNKQQYQNNSTYYKENARRREREIRDFVLTAIEYCIMKNGSGVRAVLKRKYR